jgi:hypothetical protein
MKALMILNFKRLFVEKLSEGFFPSPKTVMGTYSKKMLHETLI